AEKKIADLNFKKNNSSQVFDIEKELKVLSKKLSHYKNVLKESNDHFIKIGLIIKDTEVQLAQELAEIQQKCQLSLKEMQEKVFINKQHVMKDFADQLLDLKIG
ncbi:MAG: hypothetical protein JHC93_08380, partial [Parachlamydiales bacterium]|nr:hypothetical protein [Parachlamydiales bacterium]